MRLQTSEHLKNCAQDGDCVHKDNFAMRTRPKKGNECHSQYLSVAFGVYIL